MKTLAALLFGLVAHTACSSPPVAFIPRHAPPPPHLLDLDEDAEPRLYFTPGAAYILGLRDDSAFQTGRWIAATPGPAWPATAERPTLAVGRVVDRSAGWARVELVAVVDAQRSPSLAVAEVDPEDGLPTITKRLLPVDAGLHGERMVPAGSADFITGRELYGVLPRDLPVQKRIAAGLRGIVMLRPLTPGQSRVVPYLGAPPEPGESLILLGSTSPPALPVTLEIASIPAEHPRAGEENGVRAEIEQGLRATGLTAIRVERISESLDTPSALNARLGRPVESELTFILRPAADDPERFELSTQLPRVALHPALAESYGVLPAFPEALLPTISAAHVLIARGEFAGAAFLLEPLVHTDTDDPLPSAFWPEATPLLATCYLRMGRHDWEHELFLFQLAIAPHTPVFERLSRAMLETSMRLRIHRHTHDLLERFPPLTPLFRPTLAHHDLSQNEPERALELLSELMGELDPERPAWLTELQLTYGLFTSDTHHISAAIIHAEQHDPFTQLKLEALELPYIEDPAEALERTFELVERADGLGAPAFAARLLGGATRRTEDAEVHAQLIVRAAALADAARRPSDMVNLLATLEIERPELIARHLPAELELRYLDALATHDMRSVMGLRGLYQAHVADNPERARAQLILAHELFLSVGDHLNVAFTLLAMAELEFEEGRIDRAHELIEEVRAFEAVSDDTALTAARGRLEQRLER